ncbi:hypothetical protein J1605_006719 [Eschrichtius robustus]|uniref:PLAT domain-containing protein n=1 Tax=Eschrichtius robustus TaxID=9764 RepID=A0AB34H2A3_ESCRO|nr:hypothetical protein J1605_006719 [Eschrichtius robustus]
MPVTVCLFHSLNNVTKTSEASRQRPKDDTEQIVLWRNASTGTHPTSLNVSADYFTITVNVTSLEKSLIVCVEPESPVSVTLYLGFQHQPNHTHFHPNLSLPKEEVSQKDEPYTRVLTPESLQDGVGTYYITALLHRGKGGAQQTPALLSVVTAVTQRYFWDSGNSTWRSRDASNTIRVFLLASLIGVYMLIFVWAWRKDQADMQKVRVTVLADNDPSSQFHYLIEVSTGCRRRAATTANKAVFERGGLDVFLLGTPSSLRELHSLQLWHDSSGISPYW